MDDLEQFFMPSEPEYQGSAIDRQRKLAEVLLAKGLKQPEGQMVSGYYVAPSWTQQLAPLVSAAFGMNLNQQADKSQAEATKAQKLRSAMQIQKFSELEQTDPGLALRFALSSDNKSLQTIAQERLKGDKLGKGEVITRRGLDGKEIRLEGMPDIPDTIQTAQILKQLPKDPSTWTTEQRTVALNTIEQLKKAGAGNYNFGNLLDKGAPSTILDMLKEGKVQAVGAINTADSANRIIQALDSNKIFTGSGANIKIGAAQIADMFGIGGKDTAEKLANSRQAIQSLAQLTLQGRKQMRGEGAITQGEQELAKDAMSGKIDFTAAELRTLANAAKRAAQYTYNNYQSMYGQLEKDSPRSAPFFRVDADPSIFAPNVLSGASVGQANKPARSATMEAADKILATPTPR